MESILDVRQIGQLRGRIETTFGQPAVFVITSAARGDGKSVTAFGLAQALAQADHRVLLVDANLEAPILAGGNRMPNLGQPAEFSSISRYATSVAGPHLFWGVSLADLQSGAGTSIEKVKAAVADMRLHFDFTIIDTSPLIGSDLAILFAAVSDATLLTLRLGRLASAADDVTIKTLTRVGADVFGVITVTQSVIKKFSRERRELSAPRIPARSIGARYTSDPESSRDIVESARPNVVT